MERCERSSKRLVRELIQEPRGSRLAKNCRFLSSQCKLITTKGRRSFTTLIDSWEAQYSCMSAGIFSHLPYVVIVSVKQQRKV